MSKSPREKRHARTREAIVEAGLQILREQGVEGLSIREIANKIDYSPSGLYEYFASKEDILYGLVNEGFARLTARLEHVQGESAPARLLQAALVYLSFAIQEPQLYMLMFSSMPEQCISLEELTVNSAYSKLLAILREGVQAGEFRSSPEIGAEELSYASWAFMHGLAMLRITLMRHTTTDIDALHEQMLKAFIARLQ